MFLMLFMVCLALYIMPYRNCVYFLPPQHKPQNCNIILRDNTAISFLPLAHTFFSPIATKQIYLYCAIAASYASNGISVCNLPATSTDREL